MRIINNIIIIIIIYIYIYIILLLLLLLIIINFLYDARRRPTYPLDRKHKTISPALLKINKHDL